MTDREAGTLAADRVWRLALMVLAVPAITVSVVSLGASAAGASARAASGGNARVGIGNARLLNGAAPRSLSAVPADGRPARNPAAGTIKAGASIGTVGAPLLGGVRYTRTAATISGQAWYQLDKTGNKTATVHVKDTSASGSSCTSITVDLDNANGTGGVVSQTGLGDNGAVTLPVNLAGLYYIELSGDGCAPTGATTYSVEPGPSSAWTTPTP